MTKNLLKKNCKITFLENFFLRSIYGSDEHEYSNIRIKWPSNIIRIRIRAISPVRIYLDIHS